MKKIIICISILVILILIFIAGYFLISSYNKNNVEIPPVITETVKDVIKEPVKPDYVDDNAIKIGLYTKSNNSKILSPNYTSGWKAEEIMGIFYAAATNDESISNNSYGNVWNSYWEKYINSSNYKIGYNIKFTINGELVDKLILNPDDAYTMYPKLQFYLYDDINLIPGKPYYHVTKDTMNEKTIFTSVKIVGDTDTKYITSPIELTAFTYDSDEDFDKVTGKYRGNSHYTTIINKK